MGLRVQGVEFTRSVTLTGDDVVEAMSVRLMATKAFPDDDRTKWGIPKEDRHHE